MRIDTSNPRFVKIVADENKWLQNGRAFSTVVYTPVNADLSLWHEVTNAEKEQWETDNPEQEQVENPEQEPVDDVVDNDNEEVGIDEINEYLNTL